MTKLAGNIAGTGKDVKTLNERARCAKDEQRSMKLFGNMLKSYVTETYNEAVVKDVHKALFLEQENSKQLLNAAYAVLEGVHEFDASVVETNALRLMGVKKVTPEKEKRDLMWTVIHQRLRVQAFELIFDSTNHDKKNQRFSNRIRSMMKLLLQKKLELKGKKSYVVAQAIKDGMSKALISDIDREAIGDEVTSTVVMIVLYALKETSLLDVRVGRDENTGAMTHNITINLNMPDKLVEQLEKVAKRGILLCAPKEMDSGRTYNIVSKRSWKDYKNFPLTEDMADVMNIRNRMALSLSETDFVPRLIRGLEDKFKTPMAEFTPWMIKAKDRAVSEAEEIFEMGNEFYIEHFLDRVCRVYEKSEYFGMGQNHHLRDLIELADKRKLNQKGKWEIKMNIAALEGYDKCEQSEMLVAYDKHHKEWRKNPEYDRFFALLRSKKVEGLLLEYDATNSGPQMYAIGTRSVGLGAITGLFNGKMRLDAYKLLASLLNEYLGTDRFNRKNCKSIFMTSLYNAGKDLILWGKGSELDEDGREYMTRNAQLTGKLVPLMHTVPEMNEETVYNAYIKSMWEIAPDAMKMMKRINKLIDDRLVYEWVMPDGAFCQTAMTTTKEVNIEWRDGKNNHHTMTYGVKYLLKKIKGAALAPGIIQSIDAYILRMVKRKASSEGINVLTLHDAYFCHPNDGERVRAIYREIMAEAMEDDILTYVMNQLRPEEKRVKTEQFGDMTEQNILDSKYALWF